MGITLLIDSPARGNGTRTPSHLPDDMWQDTLGVSEVGHGFPCLDFSLDQEL